MSSGALMLDLEGGHLRHEEQHLLAQAEVGGVIFFARNYEDPQQLMRLVHEIRRRRPDILLAVDQEGGRVQRLREGFQLLPEMAVFGTLYERAPDEALAAARLVGWLMASEVLALGIDISFAPVLDLNPGISEIIGRRAVHADPLIATAVLQAYIAGMTAAGMAATGKHFPGHGSVVADSHLDLPVDQRSWAEIEQYDLQPFQALASVLRGVMPAHVLYSQVDERPAGFSSFWLQEVLRTRLGYQGAILSDDLSMRGAVHYGSVQDRVDLAIAAGCDMVLVCNDREAAEQALMHLQRQGDRRSPAATQRLQALRGHFRTHWPAQRQHPDYAAACQCVQRLRSERLS